jgi:hypothetical protein
MFFMETRKGKVRGTFERLAMAADDIAFVDIGSSRSIFADWFAVATKAIDRAILSEIRVPDAHMLPSLKLAVKSQQEDCPIYLFCVSAELGARTQREIVKFGMANGAILLLPNVQSDLGSLNSECLSEGYCVESMQGDRPFADDEDQYICVGSWARHRQHFSAAFIWNEDDHPFARV